MKVYHSFTLVRRLICVIWEEANQQNKNKIICQQKLRFVCCSMIRDFFNSVERILNEQWEIQSFQDSDGKKKKHRSRLTKKQGCPAKIFVKQIAKFPGFSVSFNNILITCFFFITLSSQVFILWIKSISIKPDAHTSFSYLR